MQLFNRKNLEDFHYGEEDGLKIMYGNKLVWEKVKVVDLGTGQSFNISNYTNNYSNLTVNNFFLIGTTSVSMSGYNDDGTGITYFWEGYNKSYNASTGVLTFRMYLINGDTDAWKYGDVHAVMVENIDKLVYLGAGQSFNVRSYSNYQDFSYKNFLMSKPYNINSGDWAQISGVRAPMNYSVTSKVNSSYSNGVFTCNYQGSYSHQNANTNSPRVRTDSMVVYLAPIRIKW